MEAGARQAPGRATIGTAAAGIAAGPSRAGQCQSTVALWPCPRISTGLTVTPDLDYEDRHCNRSKSCSRGQHCPPQVEAACIMLQSELHVSLQR